MVTRHRNILHVEIDPAAAGSVCNGAVRRARAAQIEVTLRGPSQQALAAYLDAHGEDLVRVFELAERDRAAEYAAIYNEAHIAEAIRRTFGAEMTVPKGYILPSRIPTSYGAATNTPPRARASASTPTPCRRGGRLRPRHSLPPATAS